jgi:hypothetical protein
MRAFVASSLVIASALSCGCATPQYAAEDLEGRVVCDHAQMAAIERQGQRNFAEVHWLNCPTTTVRVVRRP